MHIEVMRLTSKNFLLMNCVDQVVPMTFKNELTSKDLFALMVDPSLKKNFAVFNHGLTHSQVDIACEKLGGVIDKYH